MVHVTALAGVRAGATERHGPTASVGGVTSAREEALGTGLVGPGERSVVRSLRGLRSWGTLLLGGVFTVAGVAIDLVLSGELGVAFTACFAGGCILATAWSRRDSLFVPLVQPPLLLAVGVPLVVVATGSLPRSGGTASTLLAVGGPLVNAFPTLAITSAVCLALGFIRSRLEPWQRDSDRLDPDAPREPRDRPPRDRDPRDRDPRERELRERDRREREIPWIGSGASPATVTPAIGTLADRDPRDRDPRDREPRERRPPQVPVEARPARDDRRRPAAGDARRRPVRPGRPRRGVRSRGPARPAAPRRRRRPPLTRVPDRPWSARSAERNDRSSVPDLRLSAAG